LEFGDLADVIAGNPKTEAPPARRERWRKRRRVTGGMFIVRESKWLNNQILRPEFMMQLFYIGNIREPAGDRHEWHLVKGVFRGIFTSTNRSAARPLHEKAP